VTEKEREMINLEKDRKRKEKRRRKDGAKPREQSISRTKPWLAAGYRCRRTWERHGKPVADSSEPSLIFSTKDELATPSQPAVKAVTPATPSKPRCPEPRPVNSIAVHHNEPDPGIRPGGIRDRALCALASRTVPATPSKPQGRDRFPADNVIEFLIRKRDADSSGWRMGSRKLMPLAA
jgi:hypothetical protein